MLRLFITVLRLSKIILRLSRTVLGLSRIVWDCLGLWYGIISCVRSRLYWENGDNILGRERK